VSNFGLSQGSSNSRPIRASSIRCPSQVSSARSSQTTTQNAATTGTKRRRNNQDSEPAAKTLHPTGLANFDQAGYSNVILQALHATSSFRKHYEARALKPSGDLLTSDGLSHYLNGRSRRTTSGLHRGAKKENEDQRKIVRKKIRAMKDVM
jgi:hypothetical protein